jgi:hypothetical protein
MHITGLFCFEEGDGSQKQGPWVTRKEFDRLQGFCLEVKDVLHPFYLAKDHLLCRWSFTLFHWPGRE